MFSVRPIIGLWLAVLFPLWSFTSALPLLDSWAWYMGLLPTIHCGAPQQITQAGNINSLFRTQLNCKFSSVCVKYDFLYGFSPPVASELHEREDHINTLSSVWSQLAPFINTLPLRHWAIHFCGDRNGKHTHTRTQTHTFRHTHTYTQTETHTDRHTDWRVNQSEQKGKHRNTLTHV